MNYNALNNHSGLSIMEGLISMAILTIGYLSISSMKQYSDKNVQTLMAKKDELALQSKIDSIFNNDLLCSQAIGQTTVTTPSQDSGNEIEIRYLNSDAKSVILGKSGQTLNKFVIESVRITRSTPILGSGVNGPGPDFPKLGTTAWILEIEVAAQLLHAETRAFGVASRKFYYTVPVIALNKGAPETYPFLISECHSNTDPNTFATAYFRDQCLTAFTDSNATLCASLKTSLAVAAKWNECETDKDKPVGSITQVKGTTDSYDGLFCSYN